MDYWSVAAILDFGLLKPFDWPNHLIARLCDDGLCIEEFSRDDFSEV